jgi:DNA-binding transcriptional regulator YdaS (Cro superfamily)
MRDALSQAIENIGGASETARKMKVTVAAIYKWKRTKLPATRVLDIEKLSGVSRYQLRPDVFGLPQ